MNQIETPTSDPRPQRARSTQGTKVVHVKVPFKAWANARKAAVDSGDMSLTEYITELLYLATPFPIPGLKEPPEVEQAS